MCFIDPAREDLKVKLFAHIITNTVLSLSQLFLNDDLPEKDRSLIIRKTTNLKGDLTKQDLLGKSPKFL